MRIRPQRAGFDVAKELEKLIDTLAAGSTSSATETGSSGWAVAD